MEDGNKTDLSQNSKSQDEIDKERGFTEDELKTCIKVLESFKQENRIESLNDKRYKALRTAGLIERKKRKKISEEEDAKRIAKTKMREKKLRKLEELTESSKEAQVLLIEGNSKNPLLLTDEFQPPSETLIEEEEKEDKKTEESDEERTLHNERECYVCHVNFVELHHFYDKMCPKCASLNWEKRNQKIDLGGKVALVTGARVKIGYEISLILLRNGASVIATSRFPNDTALRFAKENDFQTWKDRLHIYGLDLRYVKDVEAFCNLVMKNYSRLDILINNAAQTIRRPPAFYSHLIPVESMSISQLPKEVRNIVKLQHPCGEDMNLEGDPKLLKQFVPSINLLEEKNNNSNTNESGKQEIATVSTVMSTAALSQIPLTAEDHINDPKLFPPGVVDEHQQQLDLRPKNSWVLEHDQVNPIELAEVHVINSISPYIMNSRLLKLMKETPANDRFIINVSSVEGMFYHKKTTKHPHTNMAKASLNMMTRTSAPYYAKSKIWMNSVDTGWISDMNPVSRSKKIAKKYSEYFRNPLDEVDGAARVLDPIFARLKGGPVIFGKMIKDYQVVPW